jgi:hypothetical protein
METKISSIRVLIKESWEFLKDNYKKIVWFACIAALFTIVVWAVVALVGFIVGFIFGMVTGNPIVSAVLLIPISVVQGVVSLFMMGVATFSFAKYIHLLDTKETVDAWKIIKSFILDYKQVTLTILLLTGLIYGGMIIIVPAIFFYYGTLFYMYTSGIEGKRGLHALIQSYWYTNGKKFIIFKKLLGAALYIVGVLIAYGIVGAVIIGLISLLKITVITSVFAFIFAIGAFAWLIVMSFVMQIFMYKLYLQTKHGVSETVDHAFYADKKKKFKIFIAIGIVLYVLFTISAPFIPDDKKKGPINSTFLPSKTIVNDTFAYELTYPAGYITGSKSGDNPIIVYNSKHIRENVMVVVFDKEEGPTAVKDFLSNMENTEGVRELTITPESTTLFGSEVAKKKVITYFDGDDTKKTQTSFVYTTLPDGWMFGMLHSCLLGECDEQGVNSILSTFKFK